jgi:hypothetical protein
LLVLRDLLGRSETDDEVAELKLLQETDPYVSRLLDLQNADGSFRGGEGGGEVLGMIRLTAQALMGLGYLGVAADHPAVRRGAEFLFAHQQPDGSFPLVAQGAVLDGGLLDADVKYHMIPLQTALPLLGLAWAGYAADLRAERAYDWLLSEELPQGGWPSGRHADQYVFAGGYRRLAHSRFGCRTNTTAAVSALAHHPTRRTSQSARRGLDLLLAHERRQAQALGFEVARTIGVEPPRGAFTYFRRYDVAQILDLSWRVGASMDDPRVSEHVKFVMDLRGRYGLWEYKRHPELSRWVTFDLQRSLSKLKQETDWFSMEPRTPFQDYPKAPKRF